MEYTAFTKWLALQLLYWLSLLAKVPDIPADNREVRDLDRPLSSLSPV